MGTVRRSTVTTMWEEGWIGRTEDFRAVKILYDTIRMDARHFAFVQTHSIYRMFDTKSEA